MSIADSEASIEYSAASSYGDRHRINVGDMVRRSTDPLYNLLKSLARLDLLSKNPPTSLSGVFLIPLPEGREIQLTMIYDVLDCIDEQSFCDPLVAPLLIRNFEAFLEGILDKVDFPLELSVRVVEVVNSLNYRASPDIRTSLKESALGDMKNVFISRCFLDQNALVLSRVEALKSLESSLENFLSSTDTKALSATHITLLMLELFVDVTTSLEARRSDPYVKEAQVSVCKAIRVAADASAESRKCISKVLSSARAPPASDSSLNQASPILPLSPLLLGKKSLDTMAMPASVAAPSQSSWFIWASSAEEPKTTADAGAVHVWDAGDPVITMHVAADGDHEVAIGEIRGILERFNGSEGRLLREMLRDTVASEATLAHRQVEKVEERWTMRLSKWTNNLQEKMKLGRSKRQRATKATVDRIRTTMDQLTSGFEAELRQRLDALLRRFEKGQEKVKGACDVQSAMETSDRTLDDENLFSSYSAGKEILAQRQKL
jgi:hypothetical protein